MGRCTFAAPCEGTARLRCRPGSDHLDGAPPGVGQSGQRRGSVAGRRLRLRWEGGEDERNGRGAIHPRDEKDEASGRELSSAPGKGAVSPLCLRASCPPGRGLPPQALREARTPAQLPPKGSGPGPARPMAPLPAAAPVGRPPPAELPRRSSAAPRVSFPPWVFHPAMRANNSLP